MDAFERLFGMRSSLVDKTCVLLPLAPRALFAGLGAPRFSKGILYSSANAPGCTIIRTGVGPALSGDAVLWLAGTPCETVILLGSCGLAGGAAGAGVGTVLLPSLCYCAESFTQLLKGDNGPWDSYRPSEELRALLAAAGGDGGVRDACCLSIGSLKLQEGLLPLLRDRGIDAVDMECASVFAAARHTGRRAAALFYVTDIIGARPYHADPPEGEREAVRSAARKAARILCSAIERKRIG